MCSSDLDSGAVAAEGRGAAGCRGSTTGISTAAVEVVGGATGVEVGRKMGEGGSKISRGDDEAEGSAGAYGKVVSSNMTW